FFQAEDGIRDATVTGVQTCALPILPPESLAGVRGSGDHVHTARRRDLGFPMRILTCSCQYSRQFVWRRRPCVECAPIFTTRQSWLAPLRQRAGGGGSTADDGSPGQAPDARGSTRPLW